MQDALPFVVVSNLPESASFYSAVTNPLGLSYILAKSSSVIYGDTTVDSPVPVFEIEQSSSTTTRPTRIVFSAASPQIVKAFHTAALRANKNLQQTQVAGLHTVGIAYLSPDNSVAKISDLNGNIMEVVYVNPPEYPTNHTGGTVRQTQSTNSQVSRILDWNLDVATSQPARSVAGSVTGSERDRPTMSRRTSRASERPDERQIERYMEGPMDDGGQLVRRKTTTTIINRYAQPEPPAPAPTKQPEGFASGTLLGSVLGAAAVGVAVGGALTYWTMNREQSRAPQQEYATVPPPLLRRSTYSHPDQGQQLIEVERPNTHRYPEDYSNAARKYPPIAGSRYAPSAAGGRSRAVEDIDDSDRRSQYSTSSRSRRRSEVSTSRKPLLLGDAENRSVASSKHSSPTPKLLMDHAYRSEAGSDVGDHLDLTSSRRAPSRAPSYAASKVSAAPSRHSAAPSRRSSVSRRHDRSDDDDHRSYTTARAPRPAEVETYVTARDARSSTGTARLPSQREQPRTMYTGEHGATVDMNVGHLLAAEFARSRKPPVPAKPDRARWSSRDHERESRVSSAATAIQKPSKSTRAPSQAPERDDDTRSEWEAWEDDSKSVVPDDSISCIGRSRRSRR